MNVRELTVPGAWELLPRQHADDRGVFLEWFTAAALREATGRDLDLAQANASVSRAGVVRGIHYADVPPGQAKYVTCVTGSVLDVVVDLRVGSPTFGRWDAVLLDARERRAVFLPEGVGHAFMALRGRRDRRLPVLERVRPEREHGVDPTDPELAIEWPTTGPDGRALVPSFSAKDAAAPSLREALAADPSPRGRGRRVRPDAAGVGQSASARRTRRCPRRPTSVTSGGSGSVRTLPASRTASASAERSSSLGPVSTNCGDRRTTSQPRGAVSRSACSAHRS